MQYEVTTFDVCVQGFERLRTNEEFILAVPVTNADDVDTIVINLCEDVEACDRPDHDDGEPFHYQEAKNAARRYITTNWVDIERRIKGLDDIDDEADNSDWPGCYAFLYMKPITE